MQLVSKFYCHRLGSNAITIVSRVYRLEGAYHCQHELQAEGCLHLCPDVKSNVRSSVCEMLSGRATKQQWSQSATRTTGLTISVTFISTPA